MREVELRRALVCAAVFVLVWGPCGECCGPGRGGGRRRSPRKLTPLVFKQHVPNVAENTLGASGLTEGRISRDDPRFNDLVPNYNADILFSDEEGTGADRLMTERCKEKLNTLAISVMNQWPGVRLRVVEAWDEGSLHAPHSLHYEGRAVDVATSDKDFSKHGMLARLAVQAGFDWVYYESRSRIHCSVKSESSSRKRLGGCFPGWARVDTPTGRVALEHLQEGDRVRVLRPDGTLAFSPVLMFLHRDINARRVFLTLHTYSGAALSLTPSHLVFLLRGDRTPEAPTVRDALTFGEVVLAGRVTAGDYLLVERDGGGVALEKVVDMGATRAEGVFAPLTAEGTLVVEGVIASCYAVIDSQAVAHWAFLPVRVFYRLKDTFLLLLHAVGLAPHISPPRLGEPYNYTYSNPSENSIYNNNNYDNKYNNKNNSSKVYRWHSNSREVSPKSESIHWYPKLLYEIASYILPSHMVYS